MWVDAMYATKIIINDGKGENKIGQKLAATFCFVIMHHWTVGQKMPLRLKKNSLTAETFTSELQ